MDRILSIGLDPDLLSSREFVLRQTGAVVHSTQPRLARGMMQSQFFNLVVLCHTLHPGDVEQIGREVENTCPACRILSIGFMGGLLPIDRSLHVEFSWQDGPGALVRLASHLLQPVGTAPIRVSREQERAVQA